MAPIIRPASRGSWASVAHQSVPATKHRPRLMSAPPMSAPLISVPRGVDHPAPVVVVALTAEAVPGWLHTRWIWRPLWAITGHIDALLSNKEVPTDPGPTKPEQHSTNSTRTNGSHDLGEPMMVPMSDDGGHHEPHRHHEPEHQTHDPHSTNQAPRTSQARARITRPRGVWPTNVLVIEEIVGNCDRGPAKRLNNSTPTTTNAATPQIVTPLMSNGRTRSCNTLGATTKANTTMATPVITSAPRVKVWVRASSANQATTTTPPATATAVRDRVTTNGSPTTSPSTPSPTSLRQKR